MVNKNQSTKLSLSAAALALASLVALGCGRVLARHALPDAAVETATGEPIGTAPSVDRNPLLHQVALDQPDAGAGALPTSVGASTTDRERLQRIADARLRERPADAYQIGAGDLLDVRVFNVPEMSRTLRVATNGSIQLPLVGTVEAAGRSADKLSADIAGILATNLVRHPQVDVFVTEYRSQRVAVTGAVVKPGLYPLTRDRYTILDVISEAGGLAKEGGSVVDFIPAEDGAPSAAFKVASAAAKLPLGTGNHVPAEGSNRAIRVDLNELFAGANPTALNLPVVAGDVIYVREAGSFTIEGWVDKPGTYPLTRETTVLAALSMGGGALLPARLGKVEVLRSHGGATSTRDAEVVDLGEIRSGTETDVALHSGDIVRVPGSLPLMVPWGIYTFVKSLISIGASIPIL